MKVVSSPAPTGSAVSITRRWLSPSAASERPPALVRAAVDGGRRAEGAVAPGRGVDAVALRSGTGRPAPSLIAISETTKPPSGSRPGPPFGSSSNVTASRRNAVMPLSSVLKLDGVGVAGRLGAGGRRGDDREVVALDQHPGAVGGGCLHGLEGREGESTACRRVSPPTAPGPPRAPASRLQLLAGDARSPPAAASRRGRWRLVGEVVGLAAPDGRSPSRRRRTRRSCRSPGRGTGRTCGRGTARSRRSRRATPSTRSARGRRGRWRGTPSAGRRPPRWSGAAGCSPRRSSARVVGVGQQVARELLRGEAVERQVPVEGVDHVVAVAPDRARVVAVVAHAVGVAHEVEPEERHALAEAGRGEEPVHLPLVGAVRAGRSRTRAPRRGWAAGRRGRS